MEKLVFLILARDKDKFNIVYVGDCEKTEDKSFFVQHAQFKCWVQKSGSEKSLHLAILPMFDSTPEYRKSVLTKIMTHYKPSCNASEIPEKKPEYTVRKNESLEPEKISCTCCGSEMNPEQILEKSTVYRCKSCGISDTRLNS